MPAQSNTQEVNRMAANNLPGYLVKRSAAAAAAGFQLLGATAFPIKSRAHHALLCATAAHVARQLQGMKPQQQQQVVQQGQQVCH
jgi:hypothetical protein